MTERKLATIRQINNLKPIPNADLIEVISWKFSAELCIQQ